MFRMCYNFVKDKRCWNGIQGSVVYMKMNELVSVEFLEQIIKQTIKH